MKDAFGWIEKIKDIDVKTALRIISQNLRKLDSNRVTHLETLATPTGSRSPANPTGTGFRHMTDGLEDPAAKLVEVLDIADNAVTLDKMAPLPAQSIFGNETGVDGPTWIGFEPTIKIESSLLRVLGLRETSGPTNLITGAIADGEFLKRVGATVVGAAGGGGEANTGSNQNIGGVGVFISKVGVDLQFKGIGEDAGSAIPVTIVEDVGNNRINLGVQAASTIAKGAVELATDGEVAASLAVQANDSRLSNARTPTAHAASHESGGVDVVAAGEIRTTTGPTDLVVGAVADGQFLKRVGATVVGAAAGSSPLTTQGDLLSYEGGAEVRKAIGTAGQFLGINDTGGPGAEFVEWQTPAPGAGANTKYAPGSTTILTEEFMIMTRRLKLTGAQRMTIQGTGALRIT